MPEEKKTVGGWDAPCAAFDYGRMEREALAECGMLQRRLRALKEGGPRMGEAELVRRREICMLTDIYYEQRHKARFFHARAEHRGECTK